MLAKSVEIRETRSWRACAAHPGAFEHEVGPAVEAVHRARGAVGWGTVDRRERANATILHYPDGTRQMQAGELLLVDAACNYGYMAADITRTYPVNGAFSDPQKDIYRIVLEAQQTAERAVKPGMTMMDVHQQTVDVIKAGLLKLDLITDPKSDQSTASGTRIGPATISGSTCTTSAT